MIVDADAHYLEDFELLAEYVAEPMRTKLNNIPRHRVLPASTGDRFIQGRMHRDNMSNYPEKYSTPEEIPEIMKFLGVDLSVQLPNRMLSLGSTCQRDMAVSLAQGYAGYMTDQVVSPDKNIYAMIIAPIQDPQAAAEIIYQYGEHPGICAVCLITAGPEPPLGDKRYDPIYRSSEDVGLPIVYHSGGSGIDDFLVEGFQKFIETHTLGFTIYNMFALVSMIVQGVPERFPKLKFMFQESGIFYIPAVMYRLDTEYKKRRSEAPLLKKLPSEYMLDFYYGTQPIEETPDIRYLQHLFEMIDAPNTLMFATDFPHWDFDMPQVITDIPFLDDSDKDRILGGNALEAFRFAGLEKPTGEKI